MLHCFCCQTLKLQRRMFEAYSKKYFSAHELYVIIGIKHQRTSDAAVETRTGCTFEAGD